MDYLSFSSSTDKLCFRLHKCFSFWRSFQFYFYFDPWDWANDSFCCTAMPRKRCLPCHRRHWKYRRQLPCKELVWNRRQRSPSYRMFVKMILWWAWNTGFALIQNQILNLNCVVANHGVGSNVWKILKTLTRDLANREGGIPASLRNNPTRSLQHHQYLSSFYDDSCSCHRGCFPTFSPLLLLNWHFYIQIFSHRRFLWTYHLQLSHWCDYNFRDSSRSLANLKIRLKTEYFVQFFEMT